MTDFYPIIQIPDDAPELPEQQGTKIKYWLHLNERKHLFKIGRENTGENWAEKVACELCTLLGLSLHVADTMDSMNNYPPHIQFRTFFDGYRFIVWIGRI